MNENINSDDILSNFHELPEFLKPQDLVDLGLYSSLQTLRLAVKDRKCPEYVSYTPNKVLFPKMAVLKFIKENLNKNNI